MPKSATQEMAIAPAPDGWLGAGAPGALSAAPEKERTASSSTMTVSTTSGWWRARRFQRE